MTRTVLLRHRNESEFPGVGESKDILVVDQPVDPARLAAITTAQVWAPRQDPFAELPEALAAMPALDSLTISASSATVAAISSLTDGSLPAALRELRILLDDGKTLRWPHITLPHLRALTVVAEFRFENDAFPHLESLSFRPDRTLRTLRQALALPLDELHLQAVPADEGIFELLAERPLRSLGLHGGTKLTSLTGIEALPELTLLRLKNLRNLSDIAALRALPRLEHLDIQYCTKIGDIEVLNDLPQLRRLTLVGCGDVGLERVQHTIDRLERRTIGATR